MTSSSPSSLALSGVRSSSLVSSLLGAMLLGAVMIFATGFSSASVVHNAAHDTRHANGFPCH